MLYPEARAVNGLDAEKLRQFIENYLRSSGAENV
jgi:hypothetical protein